MINVVVVDDQRLIYEGFSALLNMHSDLRCLKAYSNGEDFLKEVMNIKPDVVLMDIRMPILSGIETTARLRSMCKDIKVLMLTTFGDKEYIIEAMKAGANGYILKDTPFDKIAAAIKDVHLKGVYLVDSAIATVLEYMHRLGTEKPYEQQWKERYNLSDRELEVVFWIKKGLSNQEISQKMYISTGTVKNHVYNIMDKLDLRDRNLLIIYALSGERPK